MDGSTDGTPVGRRVVLGLLGLAGLGIALGSKANSALTAVAQNDPTGLTGLIPGGGRFRFYSVAGGVDEIPRTEYLLRVDGEVRSPREFTFADLAALPQTRMVKDVQCVTGWRVPDVEWSGVLLSDLLAEVRPNSVATALEFGSADGVYTESLTLDQAMRPDVLVATHMQGEPIINAHGGPVRLYVAPMYFYKSLKWLDRITVGTQVDPGYWEELGYDVDAWVGGSNGRDDAPTV
ncbi:MAG: molybdopterin-dependent oxidoreductase [Candidatus Nanopelagicales bacterium]|nr:molybdopterin-dependent oxidoreductase [Candidatus Nanopelagicales bacterium]